MRFTLHVDPDRITDLPENMKDEIAAQLPRRLAAFERVIAYREQKVRQDRDELNYWNRAHANLTGL